MELRPGDVVGDGSLNLRGRPAVRGKTGGWRATVFVYVLAIGEDLVVFTAGANLVTYLYEILHLVASESVNQVAYFLGTAYLVPIVWGFLADAYVGQLWTIVATGLIAAAGALVLTISATLSSLQPPPCTPTSLHSVCPRASQHVLNWCYAGLYLIAIGAGGLKPCMTSLGQDQFDHTDVKEKKKGASFFTGYYTALNSSATFGVTILIYVQTDVGFDWGFGIIAGLYFLSFLTFCCGAPFPRRKKPSGSAFAQLAKVIAAAARNGSKRLPADPSALYEMPETEYAADSTIKRLRHTNRLRFLDKAALVPEEQAHKTSGRHLCTVTQVEELKTIVQILPIWICTIPVYTMLCQVYNFSVQQALSMDRRVGSKWTMPAGSIAVFMVFAALLSTPLFELLVFPIASKVTRSLQGLSHLQRIGVGLVLSVMASVAAARVEMKRASTIKREHVQHLDIVLGKIPMPVYWLIPQLAIAGTVEVMVGVAQLNFFYQETPESTKSVATSLFFTAFSMGFFLSTVLVNAVNRRTADVGGWLEGKLHSGGLTNHYYLLAVILAVDVVLFLAYARWYTYKVHPAITAGGNKSEPSVQLQTPHL